MLCLRDIWCTQEGGNDGTARAKARRREKVVFPGERETGSEGWMECKGSERQGGAGSPMVL